MYKKELPVFSSPAVSYRWITSPEKNISIFLEVACRALRSKGKNLQCEDCGSWVPQVGYSVVFSLVAFLVRNETSEFSCFFLQVTAAAQTLTVCFSSLAYGLYPPSYAHEKIPW